MPFDVAIVGGGPAGLSAALTLGRACKRVALFDAGPPRNAAAHEIHNFVTRDGTPPAEFRRIARAQLAPYDGVEVQDARVEAIEQDGARFRVRTATGVIEARRILLCAGMFDALPEIPGYRELWGRSVFQCPYCHGWEVRGRAFGYIAPAPEWLAWALFLQGWSDDVAVFTSGQFPVPAQVAGDLARARIHVEERPVIGLRAQAGQLAAVALAGGAEIAREVLFVRPPQRQTPLVASLGLALDAQGFVQIDDQFQTSVPGIHAAGDLTTPFQGALIAAAAGTRAAGALNHALTMERATATPQ
jgi:thioredoxin reductase